MNRKTLVNPNFSILMLVMCEIRITGLQMAPVRNKLIIKSVLQPPYHIFDWSSNVIPVMPEGKKISGASSNVWV